MANSGAVEGECIFAERFRGHEGPRQLGDAGDRPLIRSESGAHVLGALLEARTRLHPARLTRGPNWMLTFRG